MASLDAAVADDFAGNDAALKALQLSLGALISLLEHENARAFRDQFLAFPLRADHAFWLFSSNETDPIPGPLRDRLFIFNIPALSGAERRELVKRRIDQRFDELGVFSARLTDEVLEGLSTVPTRAMIRLLDVAVGRAAHENRKRVQPSDFASALRMGAPVKKPFGFLG